jgi:hypothetical protein
MSKEIDLKIRWPGAELKTHLLRSATEWAESFRAATEQLARAEIVSATKSKRRTQVARIREVLPIIFPPDGRPPIELSLKAIRTALWPVFEKNGLKPPSTDSISRVLGRRKRLDSTQIRN